MTILKNIPQVLRDLNQWVGVKDGSKRPYTIAEPGAASTTNPETWGTWGQMVECLTENYYDHAGFVFANNGLVGIDIDTGFDEDGLPTDEALEIIDSCDSYTELSRSGRGFHILIEGILPFKGRNNFEGLEIYQTARYFIMTGEILSGLGRVTKNQKAIDVIVNKYFDEGVLESRGNDARNKIYTPSWQIEKRKTIKLKPDYPTVGCGGRHIAMVSLAGQLHSAGGSFDYVLSEVQKANVQACVPPLQESEIEKLVKSVTRYRR